MRLIPHYWMRYGNEITIPPVYSRVSCTVSIDSSFILQVTCRYVVKTADKCMHKTPVVHLPLSYLAYQGWWIC